MPDAKPELSADARKALAASAPISSPNTFKPRSEWSFIANSPFGRPSLEYKRRTAKSERYSTIRTPVDSWRRDHFAPISRPAALALLGQKCAGFGVDGLSSGRRAWL